MDLGFCWKIGTFCARILPIIYAILGFCAIVVVHELGHFFFCQWFGVHTPTFSVGIGPKIIERKIGTTNFRLSAIPLGGYCEIAGLAEPGQGEQKFAHVRAETSFAVKPYWQKALILLGGVGFNIIFAYFALSFLFVIGKPTDAHIFIKSVIKNSLAEKSGLKPGDRIISMGQSNLDENPKLQFKEIKNLQKLENVPYIITVKRADEQYEFTMQLPPLTQHTDLSKGRLGISFDFRPSGKFERLPLFQAIARGIKETNVYILLTLAALKNLFIERTVRGAGPVLIISQSITEARHGFGYLLFFLAIISISLAICNLFPIPALDGGQLVLTTIEAIFGRSIPLNIKIVIQIASYILLLGLLLVFTYNDIKYLLGK